MKKTLVYKRRRMNLSLKKYNMDGTEFKGDVIAWAKELEKMDRKIAKDKLPNGCVISTVFLSLDHSFADHGKPLIFETMVFAPEDDPANGDMERYSTKEEALEGHKRMVKKWSK